MAANRVDLINAFTGIANALDTPTLKLRAGFIGGKNLALAIWERLGRLIYENRNTIDPFGQFALPPYTTDRKLPAVAAQAVCEEAPHAADLAERHPVFTVYCWAVLNSLQNSSYGPCLDAYPYARRTLDLAEDVIRQQAGWDDAAVSERFRGMGSQLSRSHRWQDLIRATREAVRWLIAHLDKTRPAFGSHDGKSVQSNLAAKLEGVEAELSSDAHRDLEKTTPAFSHDDGKWVRNKLAAKLEGVETRTLASYRNRGIATDDGKLGKDKDGRVWRRPGTSSSHPWYLHSALKSVSQEQQRPKSKP